MYIIRGFGSPYFISRDTAFCVVLVVCKSGFRLIVNFMAIQCGSGLFVTLCFLRHYNVKKRCWSKADHDDGYIDESIGDTRSYWCAQDGCNGGDTFQVVVDKLLYESGKYYLHYYMSSKNSIMDILAVSQDNVYLK